MSRTLHVCMTGYGLHRPWTEGCAITARDLAFALQNHAEVSMISVVDYFRGFRKEGSQQGIKSTHYVNSSYIFRQLKHKGKYFLFDQMLDAAKIWCMLKLADSKYGIDIVHIYHTSRLVTSALTKIFLEKAIVAHVAGISGIGDILSRKFVDAYMCTSKYNRTYLINRGLPAQKTHLVPPIINTELYRPSGISIMGRPKAKGDSFIITYMGHLYPQRLPPEILIEIGKLAEARNIKLSIYCPDTLRNRQISIRLNKLLSRFKIEYNITISNLNKREKVAIYNAANVLIFPFRKDVTRTVVMDPPLTILESMACGKNIVASRVLSIPDIVQHGVNGFLINPGDSEGFRNILEDVIDNFYDLNYIRLNARRTVEKQFSSRLVVEKVINIYRSILD